MRENKRLRYGVRARRRKGMRIRKWAYQVLWAIERSAHAQIVLEKFRAQLPDPRDKDLLTEIVMGVLRHSRFLDYVMEKLMGKSYHDLHLSARILIRIGLYQIIFLEKIPPHAAVDATVEATKHLSSISTQLVNAVLRKATRTSQEEFFNIDEPDPVKALAIRFSLPTWLAQKWVNEHGFERTERMAKAYLERPILYLRANPFGPPPDQFIHVLKEEGILVEQEPLLEEAFRVLRGNPVRTQAYKKGFFLIQDIVSQGIPHLLGIEPGMSLIDVCVAPGNKLFDALALARFRGRFIGWDISPHRIRETRQNLQRLLQSPTLSSGTYSLALICADATRPPVKENFRVQRVLVDAPCSNLGVLRRNPEMKWRITPAEIKNRALLQRELLFHSAPLVRKRGYLLYAVCTLEKEETVDVIHEFLEHFPEFEPVRPPKNPFPESCWTDENMLRIYPDELKGDAFFAVLLKRTRT